MSLVGVIPLGTVAPLASDAQAKNVFSVTGESHETIENLGDAGPGDRGERRLVRSRSSHAAGGHARAW
jgi:hypothetical protein